MAEQRSTHLHRYRTQRNRKRAKRVHEPEPFLRGQAARLDPDPLSLRTVGSLTNIVYLRSLLTVRSRIRCAPTLETIKVGTDFKPQNPLSQDPTRIPRGASDSISIPSSAVKTNRIVKDERAPAAPINPSPLKKLKALGGKALGGFSDPIPIDDDSDFASDATDDIDNEVIFGDDPEPEPEPEPEPVVTRPAKPKGPATDFIPGSLDYDKLPLMVQPTYATSGTTKRLMKELQTAQKVQEITPLAELGWYIDVEKIENAYQW